MPRHVLFICTQNRLRSPTAEQVFADWPGIETASAGLGNDAEVPVSPELLAWADIVFVMEAHIEKQIRRRFAEHLEGKRLICLDIPDDFQFLVKRDAPAGKFRFEGVQLATGLADAQRRESRVVRSRRSGCLKCVPPAPPR